MFSVLRDSVWSKNKGGGGGWAPWAPPPGSATVNPTLPQSLHGHEVYQRGRKATTKKSLWTWIWLSGLFNNTKVRQHLKKWVSWNKRDKDWNNFPCRRCPRILRSLLSSIFTEKNDFSQKLLIHQFELENSKELPVVEAHDNLSWAELTGGFWFSNLCADCCFGWIER